MIRPDLPTHLANEKLPELLDARPPPQVKYQMLNCQGKEILVGRLKVETPTGSGHAFILRRFDTGAVSLTTMFRAAFPQASEEMERAELQWVKENHDLSGNNGSSRESHITRLAGTWVGPNLALELGEQYSLGHLIDIVVKAYPDPNASYKRSAKAVSSPSVKQEQSTAGIVQQASTTSVTVEIGSRTSVSRASAASSRNTVGSLPTPSPTANQPTPKRRKESSPAPQSNESPAPSKTPLRRSNRAKSPGAKPVSALTSANTPARKRRMENTPPVSDDAPADEEDENVMAVTTQELHDQDVRDQKKLIQDLKEKRTAAEKQREEQAQEEAGSEDMNDMPIEAPSETKKRGREEEAEHRFDFKEPEAGERQIASNRRVRFQMEPRTKSFAWGVAAFAVGMGAVSFIPNFL